MPILLPTGLQEAIQAALALRNQADQPRRQLVRRARGGNAPFECRSLRNAPQPLVEPMARVWTGFQLGGTANKFVLRLSSHCPSRSPGIFPPAPTGWRCASRALGRLYQWCGTCFALETQLH